MINRFSRLVVALGAWVTISATSCHAEDWPQWRGPFLNGASSETNLPTSWSTDQNIAWVTPLPGKSGATPIISGDCVFVSSTDPEKRLWFICLDRASGKIRWQKQVSDKDRSVAKNTLASPSAVTDGQRVIATFGTGDIVAFDYEGKELWRHSLSKEYGGLSIAFLYGNSPLLWEGRLYIEVIQRNPPVYGHAQDDKPNRESFLLCLNAENGQTLWKQVRTTDALEESMECYTTPLPSRGPNGTAIIVVGADAVTAHDSGSGAELWRYAGLNKKKLRVGRIVPSAVPTPESVFVCGPKREIVAALPLNIKGTMGEDQVIWRMTDYVPDVCTPLHYLGKLFVLDGDRQTLTCLDPATGKKHWQGRLGVREIFNASPTGADGRIYCISEEGTVVILSAGDQFQSLATIPMGEGPCFSTIVASRGHLFIRTAQNLYCVGERAK